MTYIIDYNMALEETEFAKKKRKLDELENDFSKNPVAELAKFISEEYHNLAKMKTGWHQQDMSFAYSKANYYESQFNKFGQ